MPEQQRIVLDTNCLIASLSRHSEYYPVFVNPYFNWRLIEADHDDDKFVDCAFAANATYIVSNDKHFDVIKKVSFPRIPVLKLIQFLQLLQS